MSSQPFDQESAAKNLLARDKAAKEARERIRLDLLRTCTTYLQKRFKENSIEVYLVGSITQPYHFRENSDIDIVLKGFNGDLFEIWTELEKALNRKVEVIIFESCHFKEHIIQLGVKVV